MSALPEVAPAPSARPVVYLADAGRHRAPTGYGKIARSLIRTLARSDRVELVVQDSRAAWTVDEEVRARLGAFAARPGGAAKDADVVIQVGNPNSFRPQPRPTMMLSFCDISGLTPSQAEGLRAADAVIAANRANFAHYRTLFPKVYYAPPGIDDHHFRPSKKYRSEGKKPYSFIFVGSFSFRKGVDVLLDAFIQEFSAGEAHLHLHLPAAQVDRAFNEINARMVAFDRASSISLSSTELTEAWMSRFYNRHDCFVSCSRGEGWGLPLVEAMLCEKPVIAPFSSGMADFLDPGCALAIECDTAAAADIAAPFGASFSTGYGFPGLTFEEPRVDSVRRQMRRLQGDPALGEALGQAGRRRIRAEFTEARFGDAVVDAVTAFLS